MPQNRLGTKVIFEQNSKFQFTSVWYNISKGECSHDGWTKEAYKRTIISRHWFSEKVEQIYKSIRQRHRRAFLWWHWEKIRLSEGLEHLLNNRLSDAYHVIRHFESVCVTDVDRRIFDRLIKLCLNEEEMSKAKVGDWVKQSHGGYYKIIKRTTDYVVIKQAFDHKFVYAKQSANVDGFAIELTDLKTYQFVEKEDLRTIKSFFANNPDEETEFLR